MRIAEHDRTLSAVPGTLGAIDGEITAARSRVEAVEEELRQTGTSRRRAETDLDTAETDLAKYEDQLFRARTNLEYSGLQKQIAATKRKIGEIEDRILALMEKADELDGELAGRRKGFQERSADLETKKAGVRSDAAEQGRSREMLSKRRGEAVAKLPRAVAARYERIRGARHGLAVARVRDDRCSACSVRLRPQLFEEVRVGRSILACESCSRILFFEPEPAAEPA